MTILGFRTELDPDFQRKCLDNWLELGSAQKAASKLGVSMYLVRRHSWIYICEHPLECRNYLDRVSENDMLGRTLTDEEYYHLVSIRASNYLVSEKKIREFIEKTELWRYPKALEVFKVKYPRVYNSYISKVQK